MIDPLVFNEAAKAPTNKDAALLYAKQGIGVIPVEMRKEKARDKAGKKPAIYEWQKNYSTDPDQIAEWWDDEPGHGVGIIPGTANLAVVDIDGPEGLEDWREMGYELEGDTPTIQTPGREGSGYHIYFSISSEDLANLPHTVKLGKREKIDLITVRRFVSVPPTVRPNNGNTPYRVVYLPDEFQPLPQQIIQDAISNEIVYENFGVSAANPDCARCPAAVDGKIQDIRDAPQGQGNNRFFMKVNEMMELPCLNDPQYKEAIQRAIAVVTGQDPNGWTSPISKRYASSQVASALRKQQSKGGLGTGACENALRHSRTTDLQLSETDTKVKLVRGSEVVSRMRYFLYKKLIPLAAMSFLVGGEGLGKSTFLRLLAAQVTTGTVDGDLSEPGSIIWATEEEGVDLDVVPGLRVAGANMDYTFFEEFRKNEIQSFVADDGGASLGKIIASIPTDAPSPRLVVIDSLDLFVASADMNKAKDVKRGLKGLVEQAMKHDLSVVCVQHINKDNSKHLTNRMMGSRAQAAISRAVVGWGYHPRMEGEYIASLVKGSFANPLNTPAEVFQFGKGETDVVSIDGEIISKSFAKMEHLRTQTGLSPYEVFDEPDYLKKERE